MRCQRLSQHVFLVSLFTLVGVAPASRAEEPFEGGTLMLDDGRGRVVRAPGVETDIYLRATGPILRAQVAQTFHNPSDDWVEGIYVFPLPEDAAVDRLHMVVGGRIIEGKIQEIEEARRTYVAARDSGRKATLLESRRPNLFTANVANIGPDERIQTIIEYQQLLQYDAGELRLRVPLVARARYFPEPPAYASDVEENYERELFCGGNLDSVAVTLIAEVEPGFPLRSLYSPSHEIETERAADGTFVVTLAGSGAATAADFELSWAPALNDLPQATLLKEHFGDSVYVLLVVLPPAPHAPGRRLSRDTVFVIDTSGSMHGASIEQAKLALMLAIDRLQPGDWFNVVEFNSYVRRIWAHSVPADDSALDTARRMVEGLVANGGTDMYPALREALDNDSGFGDVRQAIFVTDGAVGNERELFEYIHTRLGRTRLFTVGIGPAPNGYFMRKAAHFGRGTFTYIGDVTQVSARMEELFEKLERPVLTEIQVDWSEPNVDAWPQVTPDLYSGEPLVIAARLFADDTVVRIVGERGGSQWEAELSVLGDGSLPAWVDGEVEPLHHTESGIAKLWARRQIGALMDSVVEGADATAVRSAVVDLGLGYHLVTKYTSLVAVDRTPSAAYSPPFARLASPASMGAVGVLPKTGTAGPLYFLMATLVLLTSLGMMLLPSFRGREQG